MFVTVLGFLLDKRCSWKAGIYTKLGVAATSLKHLCNKGALSLRAETDNHQSINCSLKTSIKSNTTPPPV
jgi:hypothetical protein